MASNQNSLIDNNPQTQIPFGLHQNHVQFLLIEETPPHLSKHSEFSISPRNLHSCAFGTACSDWLSIIGQDLPGRRLMSRQWRTYIPWWADNEELIYRYIYIIFSLLVLMFILAGKQYYQFIINEYHHNMGSTSDQRLVWIMPRTTVLAVWSLIHKHMYLVIHDILCNFDFLQIFINIVHLHWK